MKEEDSQKEEQFNDWESKRDDLKSKISKSYIMLKDLKKDDSPVERVQLTLRAKKIQVRKLSSFSSFSISFVRPSLHFLLSVFSSVF